MPAPYLYAVRGRAAGARRRWSERGANRLLGLDAKPFGRLRSPPAFQF